jgi:CheY-like chemotaxis protein
MRSHSDRVTILVVADDEVFGRVLSRVLACAGRTVVHTTSAAQAVQLAQQHLPQLALIDCWLRAGDGAELAETLRARHDDLPLILMAGYPPHEHDDPALIGRFTRVLTEPLDVRELRQAVNAALATAGGPRRFGSEASRRV